MSDADQLAQLKRALQAIKELRAKLEAVERARTEPIAIIGLGCRFPGDVNSPEAFWQLLVNGVDAITEVPRDRWDSDALYDADPAAAGKVATRWGGFLKDVDQFDATFFGIAPREAAGMDPQQRLLLEVAFEAFEDAGQTIEQLAGTLTGVFIGVHSHSQDYYSLQVADPDQIDVYTGTGTAHNVTSGRLAYVFDLHGPNVAIDTACSSSLVAVHLAVQSLRNGECSLAVAGGVNVILSPQFTIAASRMRMLAPDGRCKTFDARADGFVRGEGCGVVLLKRLSAALADGDPIRAIIRGSAINQDGHTNGLTAPNGLSQQAVIRAALENAKIDPAQVTYVETHGTGTPLGDPIEVEALASVIDRAADRRCYLGSVKTNLGHLEGAAGIAGLIKTVLALQHRAIPPNLHFETLNPHIPLRDTRLVVPTTVVPWSDGDERHYAGVSSFGWSGTNAHVILEEAPSVNPIELPRPATLTHYVLPLSARAPEALRSLAQSYQERLTSDRAVALDDLCYTAGVRRSQHDYRLAVVGRSGGELAQQIDAALQDGRSIGHKPPQRLPGIVFVCPGQGSQWLGMGRQLFEQVPVFQDVIERCDQAVRPLVTWSLVEQLTAPTARLNDIDVIQPLLCAIEIALGAVWRAWGIQPDAVVGHSLGEVAAAYMAGALDLDEAMRVICLRSQLMKRVSGQGAMAVVNLSIADAQAAIREREDRLSVAVSNSPHSSVLSGDPIALEAVLETLRSQNIFCRRVQVDVAAHSPHMDALRGELEAALQTLRPCATTVPIYSTVTGNLINGENLDAAYWGRNLRERVMFSTATQQLLNDGVTTFIELSPHPILLAAIEQGLQDRPVPGLALPSLRRDSDEQAVMLSSLGTLYAQGYDVAWSKLFPQGNVMPLPAYPWQHQPYWIETRELLPAEHASWLGERAHPLLGYRLPELAHLPDSRVWQNTVDAALRRYLREHSIESGERFAHELIAAAAKSAFDARLTTLRTLVVDHPLDVDANARLIQTVLSRTGEDRATVQIHDRGAEASPWQRSASAEVDAWPVLRDWFYQKAWQPLPSDHATDQSDSGVSGSWLIFADRGGVGDTLASLLREGGATCQVVSRDQKDWQRLVPEAVNQQPDYRYIVYLWALDLPAMNDFDLPFLQDAQALACDGVLYLMQALMKRERPTSPRVWFVTRGVVPIGDWPFTLALAQALLWGFGRVVALEHADLWGGLIDLPPSDTVEAMTDASLLLGTLREAGSEDQIAIRTGQRFVPRLVRSDAELVSVVSQPVRPDATYLITGGLGSLGLQVARWLVGQGARHLVLLGRTGLPERTEWEDTALSEGIVKRISAVRALEARGATITVAKADSADRSQMQVLFTELKRTHLPLRGIVHAAGIASSQAVIDLDRDTVRDVLRAKVAGAWVLHQLSQTIEKLDFFVLFSSGASIWGSQGLAPYAAANHFMDVLAHERRRQGLTALSVNWGWWLGDSLATADQARLFSEVGLHAMPPEQALSALDYLLHIDATQRIVAAIDWQTFKPIYEARRKRPLLLEIALPSQSIAAPLTGEQPGIFLDQLKAITHDEQWNLLLAHVRQQVAQVLGFSLADALDIRQGFFKLGMDSLTTIQLRNQLQTSFGCPLPATIAFEYPTVEALTTYLARDVLAIDLSQSEQNTAVGSSAAKTTAEEITQAQLGALPVEELAALLDNEMTRLDKWLEDA